MKKSIHIEEHVDIRAPGSEVFAILADPEKHLQLGPDWGSARLSQITDGYPHPGASYLLTPTHEGEPATTTLVSELESPWQIAFRREDDSEYRAIWSIEILSETMIRLSYQADWLVEADDEDPTSSAPDSEAEPEGNAPGPETFERKAETARREAVEWLTSIKRYAELRETRMRLFWRKIMDRYILRLRSDQRRVILALLAMQIISCLTFIAAVVGLGLAHLLF